MVLLHINSVKSSLRNKLPMLHNNIFNFKTFQRAEKWRCFVRRGIFSARHQKQNPPQQTLIICNGSMSIIFTGRCIFTSQEGFIPGPGPRPVSVATVTPMVSWYQIIVSNHSHTGHNWILFKIVYFWIFCESFNP